MFCLYFILSLCVATYCNQNDEWFNCKPEPGCSIAQCDPNDGINNNYPILCHQNKSSSSADTEIDLLKKKIEEMEKSEEESKVKTDYVIKQVDLLNTTNAEMKINIDRMKEDAGESKGKTEDLIKQINHLNKTNAELETKIDRMEKDAEESEGKTKDLIKLLCNVKYGNKCVFPVMESEVDYDGGVAICQKFGGHLANIYSQANMDAAMKSIRGNGLAGSRSEKFRLGMKYDSNANKLTLRDGTDAPAGLRWWPNYPQDIPSFTNVMLLVSSDQSSSHQYLLNVPSFTEYYVLCEI